MDPRRANLIVAGIVAGLSLFGLALIILAGGSP